MRKYFYLLLLLGVQSFAAGPQVSVTVNGMVCAFCAQGITKKFKAEEAVSRVEVQLGNKLVMLDLIDGKNLSDDVIEKILKDAGYTVEKIERK